MRNRLMLTIAAASAVGAGATFAAAQTTAVAAAAPPVRGTYDPFAFQRAAPVPGTPAYAALQRRNEIVKWLATNRVAPPGQQHARSPFRPGRPPTTPPPWTPPGGGTGTNPGGQTPGNGYGQGNGNGPKK